MILIRRLEILNPLGKALLLCCQHKMIRILPTRDQEVKDHSPPLGHQDSTFWETDQLEPFSDFAFSACLEQH